MATRKAILYWRLEASPGWSDYQIAQRMAELSGQFGIPIEVDFNGIDLRVWPGETAEDVIARFVNEKIGATAYPV